MSRGMEAACIGDVGQYAALDGYTGLHALSEDPRKVDGGVDAYRGEFCAPITAFWEFRFGQYAKLSKQHQHDFTQGR
jgi:hypothetical protein